MDVVIIGAGVGGLAAAVGLRRRGHDVRVFERGEVLRTGGAALALWSNGTAALGGLGIDPTGLGRPTEVIIGSTHTGAELYRIDLRSVSARLGWPNLCLPRRELLDRLASQLPDGVVRFGPACTGVRQDADGVTALFEDGTTARADAVIGADGVHSAVRACQRPGDVPRPRGYASWQGLTPLPVPLAESTTSRWLTGPGGTCGIIPTGGGMVQWWFDLPWAPGDPEPASPAEVLRERFGAWTDPDVRAVLAHAKDEDVTSFPHVQTPVPKTWGSGRITLLGDAVHAFPPSTAQGANQALEDALVLSAALDGVRGADAAPALRRYERVRGPRAARASWVSGHQPTQRMRGTRPVPLSPAAMGGLLEGYLKLVSNALRNAPRGPQARV
ncbi:FAD-dependent oxidoreductase [Nocardiopsis tropica]|uniref:NAD(P)/FAD-dependent oxidoreductase n=1 Tax=Nocardiopsis tropica TaxID=109330 RepID=A0ABV1ZYE2_9ACTN